MSSTKPSLIVEDTASVRRQLRTATRECTERGLNFSAKWSAELLNSLPSSPIASTSKIPLNPSQNYRTSTPARNSNLDRRDSLPGLPNVASIARGGNYGRDSLGSVVEISSPVNPVEMEMEDDEPDRINWDQVDEDEQDLYLLAISYERVHEHLRAANSLKDCRGPKARWLRTYAKFLVSLDRC